MQLRWEVLWGERVDMPVKSWVRRITISEACDCLFYFYTEPLVALRVRKKAWAPVWRDGPPPGASIPQQPRRYPPTSSFTPPFPIAPFPSLSLFISPSPSLPSPPFPFCRKGAPLKPARGSGERCKLPQWGLRRSRSRHRFWCILRGKKLILRQLYTEIC